MARVRQTEQQKKGSQLPSDYVCKSKPKMPAKGKTK